MSVDGNIKLFRYGENQWVTADDVRKALRDVNAADCKILFLHTELNFGVKNPEIKRKELCDILFQLIMELGVETVVFPTFTFSYGNKEDFDVRTTTTKMGMFNEYVRKLPEAKRSVDPMMSVVVFGKEKGLLNITGEKSLGEGSIFDNLHKAEGVRFLFLGTSLGMCGTHMHYVEEQLRVPYRYDMDFYGHVTDYDGNTKEDHRILYVKYRDILPAVPPSFEQMLIAKKLMPEASLGANKVYSITEVDMYRELVEALKKDVNVFLAEPYTTHPFVKDYHYGNVTTVQ